MKYNSLMASCFTLLGIVFLVFPFHAVAASHGESELTIQFSEWADESEEFLESTDFDDEKKDSHEDKLFPQTGELQKQIFTILGMLIIIFVGFIFYKECMRGEEK